MIQLFGLVGIRVMGTGTTSDLMRTGEVAALIGSSTRHVEHLCERGQQHRDALGVGSFRIQPQVF
jgi:hypothetical protein